MGKPITRLEIEKNTLLFALSGSHAYGLATPQSDKDYKGICVAPKRFYTTTQRFEQKDKGWSLEQGIFVQHESAQIDSIIYEIRRFLELTKNQNPNILEMLWQDKDSYLLLDENGEYLISQREKFLSKKMSDTFVGYADGQIKRMKNHRKWLLEPLEKEPVPSDYDIEDDDFPMSIPEIQTFLEYLYLLIRNRIEYLRPSEELYRLLVEKIDFKGVIKQQMLPEDAIDYTQKLVRGKIDFMKLLQKNQQYRTDKSKWDSYQHWLATRNEKRSAIEAVNGYDGKHASHCIRILRMAIEALTLGELRVNRKKAGDAPELLRIKLGELPYEYIDNLSSTLFAEAKAAASISSLPNQVDDNLINDLSEELVDRSGVLR